MPLTTLDIQGPLATLTINRPEMRNALSLDLLRDLHASIDELDGRYRTANGPTACIITGAGKAFCAGMDLKQVLGNAETSRSLLRSLAELTWKIRRLPCVTLAAVNGPAIGGGCGLVTVCDLAVTFAENKMGFPEVDMGVCPAVVAPWLVRKIGAGKARKVLLQGGLISGMEAHALGIVTDCTPTLNDLAPVVETYAKRLSGGSLIALSATKKLLNQLDSSDDLELLLKAADLSATVLNTPESQAMLKSKLGS